MAKKSIPTRELDVGKLEAGSALVSPFDFHSAEIFELTRRREDARISAAPRAKLISVVCPMIAPMIAPRPRERN